MLCFHLYSDETIPPLSTASKVLLNVARTFSFSGYTKDTNFYYALCSVHNTNYVTRDFVSYKVMRAKKSVDEVKKLFLSMCAIVYSQQHFQYDI